MELTDHQIFLLAHSGLAIVLGAVFAFRPDVVIRLYRWNLKNYPLGARLRARMQPKPWVGPFYRAGGVFFIIAGVVEGAQTLLGIIRPQG